MPVAPGLGSVTPLLFGLRKRGRLSAQRRRGMQRAGTPHAGNRSTRADPRAAHHGLSGANRSAINRLAGNRGRAAGRHSWPRRLRLAGSGRTRLRLLQPRHHVWAWRDYGPRRWLTCQGRSSGLLGAKRHRWGRRPGRRHGLGRRNSRRWRSGRWSRRSNWNSK